MSSSHPDSCCSALRDPTRRSLSNFFFFRNQNDRPGSAAARQTFRLRQHSEICRVHRALNFRPFKFTAARALAPTSIREHGMMERKLKTSMRLIFCRAETLPSYHDDTQVLFDSPYLRVAIDGSVSMWKGSFWTLTMNTQGFPGCQGFECE